jgi:hypothetical protein
MRFGTSVNLDPKDNSAHEIIRAVQQVQTMFLNIFSQLDGFSNDDSRNAINLHYMSFDRVPNQHDPSIEMCRTVISAEFQPADEFVRFYVIGSCGSNGEEGSWFLSLNGRDLDTPAEIFHCYLEKFTSVVYLSKG